MGKTTYNRGNRAHAVRPNVEEEAMVRCKPFSLSLFLLLALLCGCAAPTATPTATPTIIPSPTPTETPIVVPLPAELKNLPPGATAEANGDGTWKIVMGPANQIETLGTFNPETGYMITLSDGTSVNVPIAEIGSFQAGQDTPFQIYNKTGDKITYAYDAENKVWIDAADVLQPDVSNPENYIHISSFDDIKNLARLEKMVLPPFPEDTNFPPLDKVFVDYDTPVNQGDPASEFNMWAPLGSQPPIRPASYIVLDPNPAEGRDKPSYILTEQVLNLDGSFSLFHFGAYFDMFKPGDGLETLLEGTSNGNYRLPGYRMTSNAINSWDKFGIWNYVDPENRVLDANGYNTIIGPLVEKWLTSGQVPSELENIVLRPLLKKR